MAGFRDAFAFMCRVVGVVFAVGASGACTPLATRSDVADSTLDVTRQVHRSTLALTDQHTAMSVGDVASLREIASESRRQSELAVDEAQRAADEARRAGLDVKELAGAALVAGDLATGGRVSLLLDAVSHRAVREIENARRELDAQADETATQWTQAFSSAREGINRRIDEWNEKVGGVERRVDALDAHVQAKLGALDAAQVQRLSALVGDDAAFRAYVREAARLSPDELSQLEGLSAEQILSLVLASTAAAGVGGMLGRTGKSRAQPQIDALKAKVERAAST